MPGFPQRFPLEGGEGSWVGRDAQVSQQSDYSSRSTLGHIRKYLQSITAPLRDVFQAGTNFGKILTNYIQGTSTNDNATAGDIGEYTESLVAAGSVGSWVTATAQNITSVSLAAGDWDVSGVVTWTTAGTTHTGLVAKITTATGNIGSFGDMGRVDAPTMSTSAGFSQAVPPVRISLASTTAVYIVGRIVFTAGTPSAGGYIRARRVR